MARPITAPELVYLRSPDQHSRLYLAIPATPAVFAARVNQTFTKYDMITSLTYDTVTTGAYTDIIPGMTVLIGSTAGASDVGIARARKAATSTKIFIGETSDASFADNQYITVIRDFAPWPRHPRVTASTVKMDYDIAYSDQNTDFSPIPVWGSDRALGLTAASGALSFDASGSYCSGSSISAYAWTCAGATVTNGTTATPTVTFTAPGTYQVYLTITAANGKSTLSSRSAYIYRMFNLLDEHGEIIQAASLPTSQITLNQCGGAIDSGGWSFEVTMFGQCDIASIRPRAKVILFAEEYYNGAALSIGPLAGSENIIAIGWIAEEGLEIAPDASTATFTVRGAQHWLNLESSFPLGVENTSGTASAWTNIKNLTVDKILINTLLWRTTLPYILDCYVTGDTRKASVLESPAGTLWAQITNLAQPTILARPACDRYSRLYVEIVTQYLNSKASVPVVMTITKPDRAEMLDFARRVTSITSQLRLSGIYYNGTSAKAIFSLSPGHTPKQFGSWKNQDYLLLASQATANDLAGDIVGTDNNPYPSIPIEFAQNNRMVDIAPNQFCYIDIAAADNVRGQGYTGNIIPRSVEYRLEEGFLQARVDFEAQCAREIARKGDIPISETTSLNIPESPPPPIVPPIITPPVPPVPEDPPVVSRINRVTVREATQGIFYTDTPSDVSPTWLVANYGLPVAPGYISGMAVTGLKNIIISYGVLYEDESTYPFSGLWGAASGGGTFQKILSYADVATTLGVTGGAIRVWIATNPFSDVVAAICQSTNKFEGTRKIFMGTSAGGFVAGAEFARRLEVTYPFTTMGYGNGEWRLVSHELLDDYTFVYRISGDGATITYDSGVTHPNFGDTSALYGLGTGSTYLLPNTGTNAQLTTDNGGTFSAFPSRPAGYQGWWQAVAGDLSGTVYMWSSDYPLSTDGGVNWGAFAAFPGIPGYGSRFFYYQPAIASLNEWWASVHNGGGYSTGVFNSVDNGTTWIDRTGDLKLVAEIDTLDIVEIYGM
jgi:PKD repeat protein